MMLFYAKIHNVQLNTLVIQLCVVVYLFVVCITTYVQMLLSFCAQVADVYRTILGGTYFFKLRYTVKVQALPKPLKFVTSVKTKNLTTIINLFPVLKQEGEREREIICQKCEKYIKRNNYA